MGKGEKMAKKKSKKKYTEQDDIMGRTRAAVALCNARNNSEQMKLDAFMAIFHPEFKGPRLKARD